MSNRLLWKILPFLFIAYGGFRIWEWATHPPRTFSWNLVVGVLLLPYGLFRLWQTLPPRPGSSQADGE